MQWVTYSGRLKRRPYGFCFYVVPLRLNGNRNLHPSAPLGLLLSIVTKRSVESPDYMRPFTPYFHCDCVKNARNGATIAVLFSLPQQKYNAKFSHKSKLPTLAQKDFFGTAQEGIKMTALRGKSRISLPLRLQLSCAKAHLAFGRRFHLQTATASGN